jgi:S1-C subfamily serine protease
VRIDKVFKGGLAEKAGLKEGDRLLYIDDMEVGEVDDVFIALFDKKQGDTLNIKVLRKRFFLPDKRMGFSIELP